MQVLGMLPNAPSVHAKELTGAVNLVRARGLSVEGQGDAPLQTAADASTGRSRNISTLAPIKPGASSL